MPLTEEDARRLESLGHPRDAFSFVDAEGTLTLRTVDSPAEGAPGRPCYFLKEGRCGVYPDRPAGCRIYPFVMRVEDGRMVRDEDCPYRAEFTPDPATGRRLRRVVATLEREAERRRAGVDPAS